MGKIITIFGVIAAMVVFIAQLISIAMRGELLLESIVDAFITSVVLIVAAVPE
jgi:Ca2+-transporting ATPase